jgi:hypothetical protein
MRYNLTSLQRCDIYKAALADQLYIPLMFFGQLLQTSVQSYRDFFLSAVARLNNFIACTTATPVFNLLMLPWQDDPIKKTIYSFTFRNYAV